MGLGLARVETISAGVGGKERQRIPVRQHDGAHDFFESGFTEFQRLGAHHWRVDEIGSKGVGADFMQDLVGVRIILLRLRHLLTVFGQHEAVDDDIAEGRFVEQRGRQHQQGVEPSAGLVETFSNELRWKIGFEVLFVLEWIVLLAIRHGAGFEPAVEDFWRAAIRQTILDEGDRIKVMLMQVGDLHARQLLKLGH